MLALSPHWGHKDDTGALGQLFLCALVCLPTVRMILVTSVNEAVPVLCAHYHLTLGKLRRRGDLSKVK